MKDCKFEATLGILDEKFWRLSSLHWPGEIYQRPEIWVGLHQVCIESVERWNNKLILTSGEDRTPSSWNSPTPVMRESLNVKSPPVPRSVKSSNWGLSVTVTPVSWISRRNKKFVFQCPQWQWRENKRNMWWPGLQWDSSVSSRTVSNNLPMFSGKQSRNCNCISVVHMDVRGVAVVSLMP